MAQWYRSITEVAREAFVKNLDDFLQACPGWTRASLLRRAHMDMSLIRRIERGATFATATLDKLQRVMSDVVDGKIALGTKPRAPRKLKGKQHERRIGRRRSRRSTSSVTRQALH